MAAMANKTSKSPGIAAAAAARGACQLGSLEVRARTGTRKRMATHAAVGMMTKAHPARRRVPELQQATKNADNSAIGAFGPLLGQESLELGIALVVGRELVCDMCEQRIALAAQQRPDDVVDKGSLKLFPR